MTEITPSGEGPSPIRRSVPALGLLRLGFAVFLATRPGEARMVGAREAALGLGTLHACRHGEPTAAWVAGMAVSDGGDTVAFLVDAAREPEQRRRHLVMAAFAASGLIAEGLMAVALRRTGE
jgi:hypothetical protein